MTLLPPGAPKNAVREPCLSFFDSDGDVTAEREDVAFLLRAIEFDRKVDQTVMRNAKIFRSRK